MRNDEEITGKTEKDIEHETWKVGVHGQKLMAVLGTEHPERDFVVYI